VRRLCWRFRQIGEPLEDLVQVGSVGLLKAIDKFDTERGVSFTTYAVPVIVGEIKNYLRDHGWAVKIPRKLQTHRLAVQRAVEGLGQNLGRWPTVEEIAQVTKLTHEEVYDTFELATQGSPLSLDREYPGNGSKETYKLADTIGYDDPEFDRLSDHIDLANTLSCLNKREKIIIHWKFYADLSQAEIARRLGISQMHVSRLQREALSKLRRHIEK
jgi:RNA polymerase sigma-B factor